MSSWLPISFRKFRAFKNCESGQDLVEYALLITLIALAVISGVGSIAQGISNIFTNVSTSLSGSQAQGSGSDGGDGGGH